MNPVWVGSLVALATLVLAVGGWLLRRGWNGFRLIYDFLQDWNGEPGDNRGHDPRPGVMERLGKLEHSLTDIQVQVHLNGGRSMRDEVMRNTTAIGALSGKVDVIAASVEELKKG